MHRGRSENRADRNPAIGHIPVQLVTDPATFESLGILLGAGITGARQIQTTFR